MKRILTLFSLILVSAWLSGQAPQKMSYQAVVRNTTNQLVTNSPVGMQISILQGSASGTEVYREVFLPNPQTNANGLVTVEIGSGTPLAGTFSAIDWSNGPYFLKTETDPLGGTSYTITGTSQLLSVPYALHAGTVQTISETDPIFMGSPASGISSTNITNWSSAYGWGNHASVGYITSNQAITLSGDVTGSGQTSIPTLLAANAVTTSKIADNAVNANKIASSAVGTSQIANGAVTIPKLSASGTPSATNYLRGDGQWAAISGMPTGYTDNTLYHNGSTWAATDVLRNNGTTLGVGCAPVLNTQLKLERPLGNYGAGYCNLYAVRNGGAIAANGGTNWSYTGVDAAMKGFSNYGNNFSAAIAGYGYLDFPNSAAVFGSTYTGSNWAGLAFRDATGNLWSGYFSNNVCIDGTLKLAGGSPGAGKILSSDASGNASWVLPQSEWITNGTHIYSTNSGNVGVGTISPSKKLHVEGSTTVNYTLGGAIGYFSNNQTGSYNVAALIAQTVSASDGYGVGGYMVGGYAGIRAIGVGNSSATSSYGVRAEATGSDGYKYGVFGTYTATGTATGYGLYCSGNGGYSGSWSSVSDLKFKQNIQPIDSALSRLMLLSPKSYTMKTEEFPGMNFNKGRQFGIIAQELQQVFPELVSKGGHPGETKEEVVGYLQVDYISLIPILVQALKEQQAMIEKLEQKVEALSKNP